MKRYFQGAITLLLIFSSQSALAEQTNQQLENLKLQISHDPTCQKSLGNLLGEQDLNVLKANIAKDPACKEIQNTLDAEARLSKLEKDLADLKSRIESETASYQSLAMEVSHLRKDLTGQQPNEMASTSSTTSDQTAAKSPITYIPGTGIIFDLGGQAKVMMGAKISLLALETNQRTYSQVNPIIVLPTVPVNNFNLTARQSIIQLAFQGNPIGDFTPAVFTSFTFSNNIASETYNFAPLVAYGELSNKEWKFAAGLQFDVFLPRDPSMIPQSLLVYSGNPGAYRAQLRVEHYIKPSDDFQTTLQFAISDPIASQLPDNPNNPQVLEDNGFPNFEGRVNFSFGKPEELLGSRKLAPFEIALSGVIGQIRQVTTINQSTIKTNDLTIWGTGIDTNLLFNERSGFKGEFYVGQALKEYGGNALQVFNPVNLVPTKGFGGWGELYYYFNDTLHLHVGYGIDSVNQNTISPYGINNNQTVFTNLVWNINSQIQISNELDYRKTGYLYYGNRDAWVFYSEILFRL